MTLHSIDRIYPHNAPIILTDTIYSEYGGNLANSSVAQRQAAYLLTEMQMTDDIETFLLPTTVTGTYTFNPVHTITLDYTYVHRIIETRFIDHEEDIYYTVVGTDNVHVSLRDSEYAIVDVDYLLSSCGCHNHIAPYPYQIQFVYEAGLPTGTSTKPDMLLALTTYAQVIVNEIVGYGNEAPGDIGVQEFSNQQYRETRVKLLRTSFGTSAKAQFIDKLIRKYKRYRQVGL